MLVNTKGQCFVSVPKTLNEEFMLRAGRIFHADKVLANWPSAPATELAKGAEDLLARN